jgi:hypothetical protein
MRLAASVLLCATAVFAQRVEVREASWIELPAPVDSNSPVLYRDGQLQVVTSTGFPLIHFGTNPFLFYDTQQIQVLGDFPMPYWIESVWQDADGVVFYFYHHELGEVCSNGLSAARIGLAVSYDGGLTVQDLGTILESGDPMDCNAKNGFFAGGHGDFSVIADEQSGFFYIFFTNYAGDVSSQGVSLARLAIADRFAPSGAAWKYRDGAFSEPGIGGAITPIFPARVSWVEADTDSFWGPSIHWNYHLGQYVILMSRSCCETRFNQEGIYASFSLDLSDPAFWSAPKKILEKPAFNPAWYPQVIGLNPGDNDTVSGQKARLYLHGVSHWEILFHPE